MGDDRSVRLEARVQDTTLGVWQLPRAFCPSLLREMYPAFSDTGEQMVAGQE